MNASSNSSVLDELIEPVARCFTPEVARRISSLRASPELQAKLDELADKCSAGTLTAEERDLYESYVRGMNFIGVLQASARAQLNAIGPGVMAVGAALRREVRERAAGRCEYCSLKQDEFPFAMFHVEHVIARQHGGSDTTDNLCLACHWCNFHKGPNIATLVDGLLVPLFHPRRERWIDHFVREDDKIVGLTAVGIGTVALLNMNDEDRRRIRADLTFAGLA